MPQNDDLYIKGKTLIPVIHIRIAESYDYAAIVDINAEVKQHTSAMDIAQLAELSALSSYHKVILVDGEIAGFLMAMRESAKYVNDNFAYFVARYPSFLYVDRIVIDAQYAGLKLGTIFYMDLFDYARANVIAVVTCEYNIEPSNEPSRRFHDKLGFTEIGTQWLDDGKKRVSLQVATL
jgi:predicted GNAT superfamily acetyltransferase